MVFSSVAGGGSAVFSSTHPFGKMKNRPIFCGDLFLGEMFLFFVLVGEADDCCTS